MGRRNFNMGRGGGGGGGSSFSLTSISPDIGFRLTTGATAPYLLTLTGVGLGPADTVTMGGVPVTNLTRINSTTFTFTQPTVGAPGAQDIVAQKDGTGVTATLSASDTAGYWVELAENWHRADIGTGASWTDLGDNGNDLIQGTALSQPTSAASTINSLPGFSFDGVDDFMLANCTFNSATHATYLVQRADGATVNHGVRGIIGVGQTGDSNNAQSCTLFRNNTNTFAESSNGNLSTALGPVNGVAGLIEDVYDGVANTLRVNATIGASVAKTTTMNVDRLYIGCRFVASVPSIFYPGTYCEILTFGQLPASAIRTRIRRRLANRYNQANFI